MADYVKKRTHIINHVRFLEAGPVARDLYDWGMLWSGQQETDGEIPTTAVLASPWGAGGKRNAAVAEKLVLVGLWEKTAEGFRIRKWSEQGNVTKAELVAKRAFDRERKARQRASRSGSCPDTMSEGCPTGTPSGFPSSSSTSLSGSGSREGECERETTGVRPRAEIPDPTKPAPPWFAEALRTIADNTGTTLPNGAAWLRYAGHRATKRLPATPADALTWLTGVMVPEEVKKRHEEVRQRDRDAKYDRQRSGEADQSWKNPTPEQAKKFAADLAARVAARKAKGAA